MNPFPQQTPFSMPGPQFEDNKDAEWFKRNAKKIIPAAIVLLLTIGASYFYQDYRSRVDLLKPTLDEMTDSSDQKSSINANKTNNNSRAESDDTLSSAPAPQTTKTGDSVRVTAVNGQGLTHLARESLKEYLRDKSDLAQSLKPEHRIYIEDYLQKNLNNRPTTLHPGDQLTFSNNDIQAAIDKALTLNDNQIKNLGKYAPLVPSLMAN